MTVNIAFQDDLLMQMDEVAKDESCTIDEIIIRAARSYTTRKLRWQKIFAYGSVLPARNQFTEADLAAEIKQYRRENEACS